jgi:hypothetical protein
MLNYAIEGTLMIIESEFIKIYGFEIFMNEFWGFFILVMLLYNI